MSKKSMVVRLRKRSALLGIAGSFVLISLTVIGLQSGKSHLAAVKKQAESSQAAKLNKLSATPIRADNSAQESIAEPDGSEPNTTNPGTTPVQEVSPARPLASEKSTCNLDVTSKLNAYNRDVKKERSDLDASIGTPMVGVNMLRQYTSDYNDDATKLFNHYKEAFDRAGCAFPVSAPELLPSTYPY